MQSCGVITLRPRPGAVPRLAGNPGANVEMRFPSQQSIHDLQPWWGRRSVFRIRPDHLPVVEERVNKRTGLLQSDDVPLVAGKNVADFNYGHIVPDAAFAFGLKPYDPSPGNLGANTGFVSLSISLSKQHFLYFLPLPQGQGWFLRLNCSSLLPRGSIINAVFPQQIPPPRSLPSFMPLFPPSAVRRLPRGQLSPLRSRADPLRQRPSVCHAAYFARPSKIKVIRKATTDRLRSRRNRKTTANLPVSADSHPDRKPAPP